MRMLFAYDHRFVRGDDGRLYTTGTLPASVWERYLRHFDEVHVIAREGVLAGGPSELALSGRDGVTFEFTSNLASMRQLLSVSKDAAEQMRHAVESCDAVVARLPSEIGLLALRIAGQLGKPTAVEVVGCAWDSYRNHGARSARAYAPLAYLRMRRAVGRSPLALYVTSSWLQGRYPSAGFSVSASNVEIEMLDAAQRMRREHRLAAIAQGASVRLGTIGSLAVKYKGIQTAIAAVARLRKQGLDLHYSVLGPGDKQPWMDLARDAGISDLVRFDGTREAGVGVRQWLDDIDIHLQPSFQEGLPRGTIEAMSRGAACIGSTCGGIPELLSVERTHRPGDVRRLGDQIRRTATDSLELARISKVDLARAEEYRPEILQARRDELYRRLRAAAERHRGRTI